MLVKLASLPPCTEAFSTPPLNGSPNVATYRRHDDELLPSRQGRNLGIDFRYDSTTAGRVSEVKSARFRAQLLGDQIGV